MTNEKRQAILARIRSSISTHGYHVRIVEGGPSPRFAYTIGLHGRFGFEIVFGGGSFFTLAEVRSVMNQIAQRLQRGEWSRALPIEVVDLGSFTLREAEASWRRKLLLGALDYFGVSDIDAVQVTPDQAHWTIDIPNMWEPWDPDAHPIWRWLECDWTLPVSSKSAAITNLDALLGRPITEVVRWKAREWEMFAGAGPDVGQDDIRIVPLGTMVGYDRSLECVADLEVGSGLWREVNGGEWHAWSRKGGAKR